MKRASTRLTVVVGFIVSLVAGCHEDNTVASLDAETADVNNLGDGINLPPDSLVTPDIPIVEEDVPTDIGGTEDGTEDVAQDVADSAETKPDAVAETPCNVAADCAALIADRPCVIAVCNVATKVCEVGATKEGAPCDDGDACTAGTFCDSGVCSAEKAVTITCSDFNPCTDTVCGPKTGCVAINNTAACSDGNTCTETDECANGACAGEATISCGCSVDADCAQFDDTDLCNGTLGCIAGQCGVLPASVVTCPTLPGLENSCVTLGCEPSLGKCVVGLASAGANCDDGDPCTLAESCDAIGGCIPVSDAVCQCSTDADCAEFNDENLCNGVQKCVTGQCGVDPASVVTCPTPDEGTCAIPACNTTTGACDAKPVDDGLSCNDLDACTLGDACGAGACKPGAAVGCDDGDACTLDSCDPIIGCSYLVTPECLVKECTVDADCEDGVACTTNTCNELGVCQSLVTADCGTACTLVADCPAVECSTAECVGTPGNPSLCQYTAIASCGTPSCTADADCVTDAVCFIGLCDPTLGCLLAADPACAPGCAFDTDCVDDDACTTDVCDETGTCQHLVDATCGGTPCTVDTECDDGDACTEDFCDGAVCQYATIPDCGFATCTSVEECDDGQPCSVDTCTPTLGCVHQLLQGCGGVKCATAANCDDQNPCTNDVCTTSGTCNNNAIPGCGDGECTVLADCNDGNPCTTDLCDGGTCGHVTVDGCKPDGACTKNSECNDLDACTVDFCSQGFCGNVPVTGCAGGACQNASDCDDGDACTADSCEKKVLCVHNPLPGCGGINCTTNADCTDSNGCTIDQCNGGVCSVKLLNHCGGLACTTKEDCIDQDTCTTDMCMGGAVCGYVLKGKACKVAGVGTCQKAADCDDADACTIDACKKSGAVKTCTNAPSTTPQCTGSAKCNKAADCDDSDPCTIDECTGAGQNKACTNVPSLDPACVPPPACTTDIDCDDAQFCTADLCDVASGTCSSVAKPGCTDPIPVACVADLDCADADACTLDLCVGSVCIHPVDPLCP